MKEFTTAVEHAEQGDNDEGMEFGVDGVMCRAYRPSDGQLAFLMASTGRHSSDQEQIAGLINFFVAVLDDRSQTYIINRLLDRKDKFGVENVQSIMEWMIEEWSGRPTQQPSGSTASPPSGGQKSTQRTPVLT